jgi:hypothetical protein
MHSNPTTRGAKAAPARRKLTDRYVRTVKPNATRALYWDTVQAGLALSVEPSGHKSYKLVYGFHGRSRWYTIGAADRLGLKEARQIAREKMAEVYRGVDVQAERQAARKADTFDELASRYREEYAKLRNRSWRQADTRSRHQSTSRALRLEPQFYSKSDYPDDECPTVCDQPASGRELQPQPLTPMSGHDRAEKRHVVDDLSIWKGRATKGGASGYCPKAARITDVSIEHFA